MLIIQKVSLIKALQEYIKIMKALNVTALSILYQALHMLCILYSSLRHLIIVLSR